MRSVGLLVALAVTFACGGKSPAVDEPDSGPFVDRAGFKPRSFGVKVTGKGRPVIFIPGLGCPGEVWDETVAHLGESVQSHVLTLSGFAGRPRIGGALSATVRKELVRYIRSNQLKSPIVVGHSMGGFIAYWLAATASDQLGGVIVIDAGPALSDNDVETAKTLRNAWAQAGDEEVVEQIRRAFSSMTKDAKRMEPIIELVAKSDRQTIGDSIYEMVRTDLRDKMVDITKPVLLVLADGGYQSTYKELAQPIPHHEVVVIPKTKHFVMFDDPPGWFAALDKFLADHP
jgi:N-formylmaleamate deformylase